MGRRRSRARSDRGSAPPARGNSAALRGQAGRGGATGWAPSTALPRVRPSHGVRASKARPRGRVVSRGGGGAPEPLSSPRQLDDQAGAADENLVAGDELLLAFDPHENAGLRAKVGQKDGARLLLDEAVLITHERIAREHEVSARRADLQRRTPRENAGPLGSALEDLHHTKRRGPLGRRVEVRR